MHTTKVIKGFTEAELQKGISHDASWHQDYKDSAYLFIGGLDFDMNEGDVSTVFSQYGEPVDVRLMRDRKTGKSRGFGFVAYEDQRSTVLAVDNFNGTEICGRTIRVDHVKKFKPPREFLEVKEGEDGQDVDDEDKIYKPSGPDGRGWGEYRNYTEEELAFMKAEEEKIEETKDKMGKLYDNLEQKRKEVIFDEDERWEKTLMSRIQEEEDQREVMRKAMLKKIKKEMKKRKKIEKKLKEGGEDEEDSKDKKERKEKKRAKKEKKKQEEEEAKSKEFPMSEVINNSADMIEKENNEDNTKNKDKKKDNERGRKNKARESEKKKDKKKRRHNSNSRSRSMSKSRERRSLKEKE